ncbi:MAG: dTDP-4-dehydrorhamnose reductase [Halieaceae bacterium]|jgi:dTDP-4-dehydrorhamnose reductase
MTSKAVIFGGNGQLGRELQTRLPGAWHFEAPARAQLDIAAADIELLTSELRRLAPEAVINAAAYTAVDLAESEREQAHLTNAMAPAKLARVCADLNIRLIHVSTDFVFDGRATEPYLPEHECNPIGVYGASKLAGEQAVMAAHPEAIIVRTSWLYSRFGANFVKTMLRLMAERESLAVVADQVGTPTWAAGLAQAAWSAAEHPGLHGIYHWSDNGACSWYDFAVAIRDEARDLGLLTRTIEINPIPASDYPTTAARPAYSVLDKNSSWRDLRLPAVPWRQQLQRMLLELQEHEND